MTDKISGWLEQWRAEREEFYYAGDMEGANHQSSDGVFVSNRRLILRLRHGFFGWAFTSIYLEAIQSVRYQPSQRSNLRFIAIITGLGAVLAGLGLLPPLTPDESPKWLAVVLAAVAVGLGLLAAWVGTGRLLFDLQSCSRPIRVRWRGKPDAAIALITRLTYYRSLAGVNPP